MLFRILDQAMYLSRALPAQRRSFVSTVLLSRTWENVTVVELRKEAKTRGLSTKGNKSTLIARIQEHEKSVVSATSPPVHTPVTTRSASTNVPPASPKKTSQAVSPGIPLAVQPNKAFTNSNFPVIKLPSPSQSPPSVPVQIPYVPDFWNSARPKADEAPVELEPPKLHVVSGFVAHYDGEPTHNPEKSLEGDSPSTIIPPVSAGIGFWADFWESFGLPRLFSFRRTLSNTGNSAAQAREDESQIPSRPLTVDERKGLYILVGVIGGSWLVAGFMN